jgi:Cu(I)/Ag(I) efflux system membrane fusion protein
MRCVVADKPGECPVCGMDMMPIEQYSPTAVSTSAAGPQLYTCPMHPQIVEDHPATCPLCGMELVPKRDSAGGMAAADEAAIAAVKLSPAQAVQANVEVVMPSREHMSLTLPAIGEVRPAEDRMRMLTSWQEGRVENLALRETGAVIKPGEHIMDIYSPELVQAQGEYLIALKAAEQLGDVEYESAARGSERMLEAARTKLHRIGMTEKQIAELDKTRQPLERVPVYAKYGGTVMEKKVQEGMSVMPGEELFSLVDLSRVWVDVQVFEQDAAQLKPGQAVTLTSAAYPQRTFRGKIQRLEPEVSMETKAFRARVVVDNPGGLLKPGQVLNAQIQLDFGDMLLLPRNAVLHTGDGDLVYVVVGEGLYEPRKVTVGRDFGDKVEIVSGLTAKEGVAGTAVFLLDSEAQLKGVPRPNEPAPAK